MRNYILIILSILFLIFGNSLLSFSQENTEIEISTDSLNISMGKLNIQISDSGDDDKVNITFDSDDKDDFEEVLSNVHTKFLLFDLGVNSYLYNGSFSLPDEFSQLEDLNYARSVNINMWLFKQRINLISHHLNLDYGLGFEFNMYNYNDHFSFTPDTNTLTLIDSEVEFKKNKLGTTFLSVPVMFVVESNPANPKRSFRLGAGGSAGILLGSKTKQKTTDRQKIKRRDNFNLNRFRYGVSGMIGFSWVNFYVNYSFAPLFQDGEGPELNPISFGIILRGMQGHD